MTMTAEQAASQIKRAYGIRATQFTAEGVNNWVMIDRIAELTDLTQAELAAGVVHLVRTDAGFTAIPESNQKVLTAQQRAWAVRIGGQDNHLITWN
jgi:hypothetical protein